MQSKTELNPALLVTSSKFPTATYRLQFHKDFRFKDAVNVIPYLASLGVSHVYSSPILQARVGSMHGYDIINHKRLNPEIGSSQEFDEFVTALHHFGMGLIVDFVPNHMGIGKDNAWWMDVLANGPSSIYAEYFDIDWSPVKRELEGKVLIPILGDSYGNVLLRNELKISFNEGEGALYLNYWDHKLPLNPVSYPQVLSVCLPEMNQFNHEDAQEYLSIICGFQNLPNHTEPNGFAERLRETAVHKRRLAALAKRNGNVRALIEDSIALFAITDGEPNSAQRLHKLLEAQAYRLAFWRVASDEINYRRFFDVNELAALRTEDARVFEDMHSYTFDLIEQGKVDGIRIDHPDGLYDPAGYFQQLQEYAAKRLGREFSTSQSTVPEQMPLYVVAEKILAPFEQIESDWLVHGTTGYDFLDTVNNLLVAEQNEIPFTEFYQGLIKRDAHYEEMRRECKGLILDTILASELTVLAHRLSRIAETSWTYRDFTLTSLRHGIRDVVVNFPVYRTYAIDGNSGESVAQYIDWAIALAKRNSTVADNVLDFIGTILRMEFPKETPLGSDAARDEEMRDRYREFALKFQQFTGPVTAKSVEDTLFYRYNRFVGLNEVGGEPKRFGTSTATFHYQNSQRREQIPFSMLSTSTHDTKRSEDVRARLAVISELPTLWQHNVLQWIELNAESKTNVGGELAPDINDEYMLYQNIVGAFPLEADEKTLGEYIERLCQYASKALREAKVHTSWLDINEPYETAVHEFIRKILTPSAENRFLPQVKDFSRNLHKFGSINSIVQLVLKLTSPGVPDIYQGAELFDLSLVDPDNRRPVNYEDRHALLKRVGDEFRAALSDPDMLVRGGVKLTLISALLHYRQLYPELFREGQYIPLETAGAFSEHVVAFARKAGSQCALVVVPLKTAMLLNCDSENCFSQSNPIEDLSRESVWQDTHIVMPPEIQSRNWDSLFLTAENFSCEGAKILVGQLFKELPVAVLISGDQR